jgi:hypothetical protein
MRDEREIQQAHDILVALVTGEIPIEVPPSVVSKALASLDVLCWALGHTHNPVFGKILDKIQAEARGAGYVLEERVN